MTTISKCHVTLLVGPLILSHHPAKFGVHKTNGTGNNGVCDISSNSNFNSNFSSNSNAEVYKALFIVKYIKNKNLAYLTLLNHIDVIGQVSSTR